MAACFGCGVVVEPHRPSVMVGGTLFCCRACYAQWSENQRHEAAIAGANEQIVQGGTKLIGCGLLATVGYVAYLLLKWFW